MTDDYIYPSNLNFYFETFDIDKYPQSQIMHNLQLLKYWMNGDKVFEFVKYFIEKGFDRKLVRETIFGEMDEMDAIEMLYQEGTIKS